MILSKKEQDEFFGNYFFLLFYSAVYEGILPQNSRLTDFSRLPLKMMAKSRDALFTDWNIMNYCLEDNKKMLTKENVLFAENVRMGIFSEFIVLKVSQDHFVLLRTLTSLFYKVTTITESFDQMLTGMPTYINTAIFNFKGKIVCDGLLNKGYVPIAPVSERRFMELYRECDSRGEIITLL
jgi:hypothetical protein